MLVNILVMWNVLMVQNTLISEEFDQHHFGFVAYLDALFSCSKGGDFHYGDWYLVLES
jgi:hypothetical protein